MAKSKVNKVNAKFNAKVTSVNTGNDHHSMMFDTKNAAVAFLADVKKHEAECPECKKHKAKKVHNKQKH